MLVPYTDLFTLFLLFFFSSRRRHTRWPRDWSSDVCSSDLQRDRSRCVGKICCLPSQQQRSPDRAAIDRREWFRGSRRRSGRKFFRSGPESRWPIPSVRACSDRRSRLPPSIATRRFRNRSRRKLLRAAQSTWAGKIAAARTTVAGGGAEGLASKTKRACGQVEKRIRLGGKT